MSAALVKETKASTNYTITAWINPDAINGDMPIIVGNYSPEIELGVTATGHVTRRGDFVAVIPTHRWIERASIREGCGWTR